MLDSGWDDEQIAGSEDDRVPGLKINSKAAVPAQEQLVLVVNVPRELTVEPGDPYHRVVGCHQVARLPGLVDGGDGVPDGDRRRLG